MKTDERSTLVVEISKRLARKGWTLNSAAVHAGAVPIEQLDDVRLIDLSNLQLQQIIEWTKNGRTAK